MKQPERKKERKTKQAVARETENLEEEDQENIAYTEPPCFLLFFSFQLAASKEYE